MPRSRILVIDDEAAIRDTMRMILEYDGHEVVLAGSFTRPVDIIKGDTFHADYGQFGSVSCQFV